MVLQMNAINGGTTTKKKSFANVVIYILYRNGYTYIYIHTINKQHNKKKNYRIWLVCTMHSNTYTNIHVNKHQQLQQTTITHK